MKDFENARNLELEEVFKKIVEDKDKFLNISKDNSRSYEIWAREGIRSCSQVQFFHGNHGAKWQEVFELESEEWSAEDLAEGNSASF